LVKEHAARVKPPRTLAVPFPYGSAMGRANDSAFQHKVLAAALGLLKNDDAPVLAEFPNDGEGPVNLLQASAVQGDGAKSLSDPADELTSLREYYERWVDNQGGRTLLGLTGVAQRRFRGIVRYLQHYSQGVNGETPERPDGVSEPLYIRWCIDDLKAFYYEARMEQRSGAAEEDLHRWFWGETAMGNLIVDLGKHMDASEDPEVKGTAFGLSR
jgi:hypothetical protein